MKLFCTWWIHRQETPPLAIARCTWATGHTDQLCQKCLDDIFDYADDDPISEPDRVQWFDGSRTLVAA